MFGINFSQGLSMIVYVISEILLAFLYLIS
jgi:hypothetical protein